MKKRASAKSREGEYIAQLLQQQGMEATIQALRQHSRRALPGLWEKNDFAARQAWKEIAWLNDHDQDGMRALVTRQRAAFTARAGQEMGLAICATATAPFTTGLGNEHPLENGFAFLWPYGLPYLPGSGVKGVVRRAAEELASGMWGDKKGWNKDAAYPLMRCKSNGELEEVKDDRGNPILLSVLEVLFGREPPPGDSNAVRGALAFWDVIPEIAGNALMVEIMTPHQSHYYQEKRERKSGDSVSPHDSGQPNPIAFLTVPPGSTFCFHVVCDVAHLARLTRNKLDGAPDLLVEGNSHWTTLLAAAFEHAFQWLGFGAKTAVGYGAMESAPMRAARLDERKRQAEEERALREQEAAVAWPGARLKFNRANKALTAEKDGKTAIALAPRGEELLSSLPAEIREKVETNQFVKVMAHVAGQTLVRVEAP
ncbi:type III-B CRISPR module RAMP protein Cmr6 [Sulfuricystis multivorans]|uniref:type III-B CRISPR module RAMP protein Cmr6 n=1 Tax=Sulfuricystis multivorans TaxID=2211108 RepID=UPI001558437B|nr:type III-B CRISPR module RAMP protein Cmr6 [Sulfuricystis multivorans]